MITELKEGVYWIGVVDWSILNFHGYELSTHRGTTYNSYLIIDKKITVVDSVAEPFKDAFIANICKLVDPSSIDIVVANHAEPDHSGSLPMLMHYCPKATVIVSKRGAESIPGHFHENWNLKPVKTGDKISLGKHELVFIEAPMLHWPDSMFTYLPGHNILMPNDAFGQHYATAFRFNDQVDQVALYEEALKYYANILTPFSEIAAKKIDEVMALNLPVDIIAPSHGVIWRNNPLQIVLKYREWAKQIPEKKAVILYDTMWQATRRMAEAIAEGLISQKVPCELFLMPTADRNDVIAKIFKSKAIIVGSPTLNNGLLPTITPVLEDIRGLKLKNKIGAAFGSYGWSGETVTLIEDHLKRAGINVVHEGVKCKWQPDNSALEACRLLGTEVGRIIMQS